MCIFFSLAYKISSISRLPINTPNIPNWIRCRRYRRITIAGALTFSYRWCNNQGHALDDNFRVIVQWNSVIARILSVASTYGVFPPQYFLYKIFPAIFANFSHIILGNCTRFTLKLHSTRIRTSRVFRTFLGRMSICVLQKFHSRSRPILRKWISRTRRPTFQRTR